MFATTQIERQQVLARSQIIEQAKAASRELTPGESAQVNSDITRIRELDARTKTHAENARKVMALGTSDDPESPEGPFDGPAKEGFLNAIRSKTSFRVEVPRSSFTAKAAITGSFVPPAGEGVAPALYPNMGPVAVTSLMQTVPVSTPTVRFYQVSSGTAAVVTEGSIKPDANIAATPKDVALVKIAGTFKVTDELSDDAPYMLAALQAALVGAVISKENEECISTIGAASGILVKTGAAADAVDILADSIAGMQALGVNPSAILVTPTTLATVRKTKSSGSGTYVTDPLAPGPAMVHGVPLYAVPVAGAGTAWVLDGSGLAYFRRNQVTFELGSDSDDWVRNVRTARAESRGKCGVLRPKAVTRVTLT